MAQIKKYIKDLKKVLDEALSKQNFVTNALDKLEQKTGIKKINFVLGLIVFVALYLMFGYGGDFLCNFIGFLYPAYASIKAIESKEKDDDTKWLTYWVVYSVFSLVEFFTDIFLFWIPLYWFAKCVFLIYCMVPTPFNGAVTIYYKIIRPYILKYEKTIDDNLSKISEKGVVPVAIGLVPMAMAYDRCGSHVVRCDKMSIGVIKMSISSLLSLVLGHFYFFLSELFVLS